MSTIRMSILALALLPMTSFADGLESHYCSAQVIFRDGEFNEQVRVECGSDYAGNCIQEVLTNGQWNWKVVSNLICDEKAKAQ